MRVGGCFGGGLCCCLDIALGWCCPGAGCRRLWDRLLWNGFGCCWLCCCFGRRRLWPRPRRVSISTSTRVLMLVPGRGIRHVGGRRHQRCRRRGVERARATAVVLAFVLKPDLWAGLVALPRDVERVGWPTYLHFLLAKRNLADNLQTRSLIWLWVDQVLGLQNVLVFFAVERRSAHCHRVAELVGSWRHPKCFRVCADDARSSSASPSCPTDTRWNVMMENKLTKCACASGAQEVCCLRLAASYSRLSLANAQEMQSPWSLYMMGWRRVCQDWTRLGVATKVPF